MLKKIPSTDESEKKAINHLQADIFAAKKKAKEVNEEGSEDVGEENEDIHL